MEFDELRKRVSERATALALSSERGPVNLEYFREDVGKDLEEEHLARVAFCDAMDSPHPVTCECHWCTHDSEFDQNPEKCAACQAELYVYRADSDWSESWLCDWDVTNFMHGLIPEIEGMRECEDEGGRIEIRLEKMTHYRWWQIVLKGEEFEGFC